MAMLDPSDLEMLRYLRNKVEKGENNGITELDVYKDEPWLLEHVEPHTSFRLRQWFYFVPRRTQREEGPRMRERLVEGRKGESKGGMWRVDDTRREFGDEDLKGYKEEFVYQKREKETSYGEITTWFMREYSFRDAPWALCWIQHTPRPEMVNGELRYPWS